MAFTGTQAISAARDLINDQYADGNASQRWTDAILLRYLNEGTRIIAEKRPDSLLTAAYTIATYADASAVGSTVVLGDKYFGAAVDFICHRALGSDSQDERDLARSKDFFQSFVSKAGILQVMSGSNE